MAEIILALNAGSSSLKFALYRVDGAHGESSDATGVWTIRGGMERDDVGLHFVARDHQGRVLADERVPVGNGGSHADVLMEACGFLLDWIDAHTGQDTMVAAGHRVVHGGRDYLAPVRISQKILTDLDALTSFDPLHQPASLSPIRALFKARPHLPQIACFDTSFHQTMPDVASRLALPRRYGDVGVRRYGFHGLSYAYIASRLPTLAPDIADGRIIVAHLGNGASLCALRGRKSIETTMGFSSLDGLVMGTRCGAVDPGVLLYMLGQEGHTVAECTDVLYWQSGLLGVSGISGDMRALRKAAPAHSEAKEALALYVYRIIQEIGALTAVLGGVDGIIFTAGVGEHDAALRQDVCAGLDWLGVHLNNAANEQGASVISMPESRVRILVEPTDEDEMIFRAVQECLRLEKDVA